MEFLFLLFNPIFGVVAFLVLYALIFIFKYIIYKRSSYYRVTNLSYVSMRKDPGRYGEYLSYCALKSFEKKGAKFLFNVYIPKDDGDTTEIDVLMIYFNGIYVIESKNYGGWIFGGENQFEWYQTFRAGKKKSHREKFYNPISQNRNHIKHLKNLIGESYSFYPIVAFSDRCTFKRMQVSNSDTIVTTYSRLKKAVLSCNDAVGLQTMSECEIRGYFNELYPYSQVSTAVKSQHIQNINNKINHT